MKPYINVLSTSEAFRRGWIVGEYDSIDEAKQHAEEDARRWRAGNPKLNKRYYPTYLASLRDPREVTA